jgi:hypothetical protein
MILTFEEVCKELLNIAINYISVSKQTQRMLKISIFKNYSEELETAIKISDLVYSVRSAMTFPMITYSQKIDFLSDNYAVYSKLMNYLIKKSQKGIKINKSTFQLFTKLSETLKLFVMSLSQKSFGSISSVKIYYFPYYLDSLAVGMDCATNTSILKEELIQSLYRHLKFYSYGAIAQLINSLIDTIKEDQKSINLYAVSDDEKFANILRFVNPLRLKLIERDDKILLPDLQCIMNKALEITLVNECNNQNKIEVVPDVIHYKLCLLLKDFDNLMILKNVNLTLPLLDNILLSTQNSIYPVLKSAV